MAAAGLDGWRCCPYRLRINRLRFMTIMQNRGLHRALDYEMLDKTLKTVLLAFWASEMEETVIWGVYAYLISKRETQHLQGLAKVRGICR
jgi:hypothetical protein